MIRKTLEVISLSAILNPSNENRPNPETFFVTAELSKSKCCEKCFGNMKKDKEIGWIPATRGPISGWDVHKFVCENCDHQHEIKISRD